MKLWPTAHSHLTFKFPFIALFHGDRLTVGADSIRPKSFDFAEVFYKSYTNF